MKAALVYTSTTPELIELVEKEVTKNIEQMQRSISLQDPSILAEVREAGYVTKTAAARLIGMYMEAVAQGADAILNICSSVGEVADSVQTAAAYIGVPIVRIDEEMCREAARTWKESRCACNIGNNTGADEKHHFSCRKSNGKACRACRRID